MVQVLPGTPKPGILRRAARILRSAGRLGTPKPCILRRLGMPRPCVLRCPGRLGMPKPCIVSWAPGDAQTLYFTVAWGCPDLVFHGIAGAWGSPDLVFYGVLGAWARCILQCPGKPGILRCPGRLGKPKPRISRCPGRLGMPKPRILRCPGRLGTPKPRILRCPVRLGRFASVSGSSPLGRERFLEAFEGHFENFANLFLRCPEPCFEFPSFRKRLKPGTPLPAISRSSSRERVVGKMLSPTRSWMFLLRRVGAGMPAGS